MEESSEESIQSLPVVLYTFTGYRIVNRPIVECQRSAKQRNRVTSIISRCTVVVPGGSWAQIYGISCLAPAPKC